MIHSREALATALGVIIGLSACAAPGYHFNAGELHQTPNDPCQRQEVRSAGAVSWLNMKVGAPDGPPKRVVSIQNPSGSGYGSALACRAFLVFEDGTTQAGQLTVIDPGGTAPLSVRWTSDAEAAGQQQLAQHNQRQVGPSRPSLRQEATRRFCASSTPMACAMFETEAYKCEASGAYAYSARDFYIMWRRRGGLPQNMAVNQTAQSIHDRHLAELAGSAPDNMTPDEFRTSVIGACLEDAAR